MKTVITDSGRDSSKRPKQKNDCTVRAIVEATGAPYDKVYDILSEAGRKCGGRFHLKDYFAENPHWGSFKIVKMSFPAIAGQRRMNPKTFAERYPLGTYIVRVSKHVFCIKGGVAYDNVVTSDDRCIYMAWEFQFNFAA